MDKTYQDVHIIIDNAFSPVKQQFNIRQVRLVGIDPSIAGFMKIHYITDKDKLSTLIVPQISGLSITID